MRGLPPQGSSSDTFLYRINLRLCYILPLWLGKVNRKSSRSREYFGVQMPKRCGWVTNDPLYLAYHDSEWGVPEHDDQRLFELLILEGAQAGLSWLTVLKKRDNYRKAFAHFAAHRIATFGEKQIAELLANEGIIRNRLKIAATIQNARAFLAVQKECGSFAIYLWQFVGGKPKTNAWQTLKELPAKTVESDTMSKDLTK